MEWDRQGEGEGQQVFARAGVRADVYIMRGVWDKVAADSLLCGGKDIGTRGGVGRGMQDKARRACNSHAWTEPSFPFLPTNPP